MSYSNYFDESNKTNSSPAQNNQSNNNLIRNIIIGLLALALAGSWYYFLQNKKQDVQTINTQTQTIQQTEQKATVFLTQRDSVQMLFTAAEGRIDSINLSNTQSNTKLNSKITTQQREIDTKKTEIRKILSDKNATVADLTKAKNLIGDLNTQINQLKVEVTRLTNENGTLKTEKADLQKNLETTKTQNENLEKTVEIASTFNASNIQVTPVDERNNGKEKETTKAKKVNKLVVSFDVENRIAKSGPTDFYLIVTAPDGTTYSEAGNTLNTKNDGNKNYAAKININYNEGAKQNIEFPIRRDKFETGDYKVEIYQNGFKIGEATRSLRKGGLFG